MSDLIDIIRKVSDRSAPIERRQGEIISVSGDLSLVNLGGYNSAQRAKIPENIEASVGQIAIVERTPRSKEWMVVDVVGKGVISTSIQYPTYATLWHSASKATAGTAITTVLTSSQIYCAYTRPTTPANGDTFEQQFLMAAGTYNLTILYIKNTYHGKLDLYIDDVLIFNALDLYAASIAFNQMHTGTVSLVTSGLHTLRGVTNGKNISSSDYYLLITAFWLKPQ